MNWFYNKDGQQVGPVAFTEIERLHAEGQLSGESLVWQQGTPNWIRLGSVLSTGGNPSIEKKNNVLAIVSLALGIFSLLGLCCPPIGIFFGIPAVICGHIALSHINKAPALQTGGGLAVGGLITGYIAIALAILGILLYATGSSEAIMEWAEEQRNAPQTQSSQ